jgi:YHS domain-containing protein
MTVEPASAAAAWEHANRVFYFCSVPCMMRFRNDPEHYLALDDDRRRM